MINIRLQNLINKARKIAIKHRDIVTQVDKELEALGYDIETIRYADSCGYVDTLDYGRGTIDYKELEEYRGTNGNK